MAKAAFVFDLDMTLVDSSALDQWRFTGQWGRVFANLNLVQPFRIPGQTPPHELPAALSAMGHPIAIVTSSAGNYAKQIVQNFGIKHDTLVTYHDIPDHPKPEPDSILLALSRLGCDPRIAYCVGDAGTDVQAGYRAGATTIGVGWGVGGNWSKVVSHAPDIFVHKPDVLLDPTRFAGRGYLGTAIASNSSALLVAA